MDSAMNKQNKTVFRLVVEGVEMLEAIYWPRKLRSQH